MLPNAFNINMSSAESSIHRGSFTDSISPEATIKNNLKKLKIYIPDSIIDTFLNKVNSENIEVLGGSIFDGVLIISLSKNGEILKYEDRFNIMENIMPELLLDEDKIIIA